MNAEDYTAAKIFRTLEDTTYLWNAMSSKYSQDEYFIRERKHRFPDDAYKGFAITAYTLCIQDRMNAFADPVLFKIFESHLQSALHKHSVNALVYLFMPDHCHLLLQGTDPSSNSRKAVTLFKQTTGFWLSKNLPSITWQKDFYDHVLRKDDDLNKQIRYILLNPVRKELVSRWDEYLFRGSTVFDLQLWAHEMGVF